MDFIAFIIILLCILYVIFEPALDKVPLYLNDGDWIIMWYNKYSFSRFRVTKKREWIQLFCID